MVYMFELTREKINILDIMKDIVDSIILKFDRTLLGYSWMNYDPIIQYEVIFDDNGPVYGFSNGSLTYAVNRIKLKLEEYLKAKSLDNYMIVETTNDYSHHHKLVLKLKQFETKEEHDEFITWLKLIGLM